MFFYLCTLCTIFRLFILCVHACVFYVFLISFFFLCIHVCASSTISIIIIIIIIIFIASKRIA